MRASADTNTTAATEATGTSRQTPNAVRRTMSVNWRFLIVVLLTISVVLAGLVVVHGVQVQRNAEYLLSLAASAEADGEYDEAIRYLSQYQLLVPDDFDAQVQLARLLEQTATSIRGKFQALGVYERILLRDPERSDADEIRRSAIELSMLLRRYRAALDHLIVLRERFADDPELAVQQAQCQEQLGELREARDGYLRLIATSEVEIDPYVGLAGLLTRNPQLLPSKRLPGEAASLSPMEQLLIERFMPERTRGMLPKDIAGETARKLIETMVARGDPSHRALAIAAGYYLAGNELAAAEEHIEESLRDKADDAAALQTAVAVKVALAEEAQQQARPEDAEKFLNQAAQRARQGTALAAPDKLSFYALQAEVELRRARLFPQKAAELFAAARSHLETGRTELENYREKVPESDLVQVAALRRLEIRIRYELAELRISQVVRGQGGAVMERPAESILEVRREIEELTNLGAERRLVDLLEGRLLIAERRWGEAAERFSAIRPRFEKDRGRRRQIDRLLGNCYEFLAGPHEQVRVFERAITEDPAWVEGSFRLAQAYQAAGELERAAQQYRSLLRQGYGSVWLPLVRVLVLQQLNRPADRKEGEWKPILSIVEQVKQNSQPDGAGASRWREAALWRARVLRLQGKLAQGEPAAAKFAEAENELGELRQAFDDVPEDSRIPAELARLERDRRETPEAALAVVEAAKKELGETAELLLVEAEIAASSRGKEAQRRLQAIAASARKLPIDESEELLTYLAVQCEANGDVRSAEQLWRRLADSGLAGLNPFLQLARLRLDGPEETFRPVIESIRKLEGPQSPGGDFFEAVRTLRRVLSDESLAADGGRLETEFEKPRRRLESALRRRPHWPAVHLALGDLEYALSNWEAAVDHYRNALERGSRSERAVLRAVALLEQQFGRHADAAQVLRTFAETSRGELSERIVRLSAARVLEKGDLALMSDLAEGFSRGAAAESVRDEILKADLLVAEALSGMAEGSEAKDAKLQQADALYRTVIRRAPRDPFVWEKYVLYLSRTGQVKRARRAIEDAGETLPEDPPWRKLRTLARLYRFVADRQQAARHYELALKSAPDSGPLRQETATFYFLSREIDEAATHVSAILTRRKDYAPSIVSTAQRLNVMLLAHKGEYRQALQELKILARQPGVPDNELLRAQAAILAESPRVDDRKELINVLEQIDRHGHLSLDRQVQLAQLYELVDPDNGWEKARQFMQRLIRSDPANSLYLALYAEGLIKRGGKQQLDEAQSVLRRLQSLEPDSYRTHSIEARLAAAQQNHEQPRILLEDYLARAETWPAARIVRNMLGEENVGEIIQAVLDSKAAQGRPQRKRVLEQAGKLLARRRFADAVTALRGSVAADDLARIVWLETVRRCALLLDGLGDKSGAEDLFERYVQSASEIRPNSILLLVRFHGRKGKLDRALALCEAAWSRLEPEEVAPLNFVVVRQGVPAKDAARFEKRLESALVQAPDSEILNIVLADYRDYQGRYDEAERVYRRLLEKHPASVVARNNLAWLLALRRREPAEALSHIREALRLRGGAAIELLDTYAVVLLAQGDEESTDRAIEVLKTAIDRASQPTHYFHLAAGYFRQGKRAAAAEALQKAHAAGLKPEELHPLERGAYRKLAEALGGAS